MYFIFFACLLRLTSSDVVKNTNNGPVRGISSLEDGVEAYLGIPYAEPPVGELRFAKPIPKKNWSDVYDASALGPPCLQLHFENYYFMPETTNMSKDCLYLNIWAPRKPPTNGLRPMIIFVHHGAFVAGSSTTKIHDGSRLASRGDIVVASFNFRLGVFAYFLAYTEQANGNVGEYDKVMAIKWLKENAKYFNADPENITLMGASAGAFSVSGLMVSPLSQDLFRRAIILGGSVIHPFFMDNESKLFKSSQIIASITGCSNETVSLKSNPQSVINCLKSKPGEDLIKAHKIMLLNNAIAFFPRVNDEFFPQNPTDLFREGKFGKDKDVLFGITKNEGSMIIFSAAPEYVGVYGNDVVVISKNRALAINRGIFSFTGLSNTSEINDYYMKHVKNRDTYGYLKMISNILGDFTVSCNTIFNADIVSLKGNRVYFYKLEFRSPTTPTAEWVGTTHLDELQYVFGNPYHENFTAEEIELSHNIMDRWSAFARKG